MICKFAVLHCMAADKCLGLRTEELSTLAQKRVSFPGTRQSSTADRTCCPVAPRFREEARVQGMSNEMQGLGFSG